MVVDEAALARDQKARNHRLARWVWLIVLGMSVFAWTLVPIYKLACERLGLGTAPQRPSKDQLPAGVGARTVVVRFVGLSNAGMPATLEPLENRVVVHVGETREVNYRFTNLTDHSLAFQAVHSVVPNNADAQFHKLECFCFTKQELKPRETRILPVSFWIDPKLGPEVDTVTLQYTLFNLNPERPAAATS